MSRCRSGQQGTLCIRKYRCDYVLPPLLSTGQMAMNADLLAPGSKVFYGSLVHGSFILAHTTALIDLYYCSAMFVFGIFNNEKTKHWETNIAVETKRFETVLKQSIGKQTLQWKPNILRPFQNKALGNKHCSGNQTF